ncbi:hypothetical protein DMP17_04375 [Pseudonocardia sp. TMWB2A]
MVTVVAIMTVVAVPAAIIAQFLLNLDVQRGQAAINIGALALGVTAVGPLILVFQTVDLVKLRTEVAGFRIADLTLTQAAVNIILDLRFQTVAIAIGSGLCRHRGGDCSDNSDSRENILFHLLILPVPLDHSLLEQDQN